MTWPDTNEDSSLTKYETAAAMSSGRPTRPTGISFTAAALNSSNLMPSRLAVAAVPSPHVDGGERRGFAHAGHSAFSTAGMLIWKWMNSYML